METTERTKFCKHCGAKIPEDAVLCTACGRQVEKLENESAPNIVINNSNSSQNANTNINAAYGIFAGKLRNKWVALALCFFRRILRSSQILRGQNRDGNSLYFHRRITLHRSDN